MIPPPSVSQSRFYVWRTIVALVHADGVVTDEEIRYIAEAMEHVPFSDKQRALLKEDMSKPQKPMTMFAMISDKFDQSEFFKLAAQLVHIDGDYGSAEQDIMLRLKEAHIKQTNVDDLVHKVRFDFEDEPSGQNGADGLNQKKSFFEKVKHFFS